MQTIQVKRIENFAILFTKLLLHVPKTEQQNLSMATINNVERIFYIVA